MAKEKAVVCYVPCCREPAVGEAWSYRANVKPIALCVKHLEVAKKLGNPIKLFSDTDVVYNE